MKILIPTVLASWLALAASAQRAPLSFAATPSTAQPTYRLLHSAPTEPYLTTLRTRYHLDSVVAGHTTDMGRVQALCAWVSRQWQHNGWHTPQKSDPISILEEAAQGKQFRCVEYGIVLSGALASLGIPARVLALKTADVETRKAGAGHVLTEVWLRDQQKWVLVDGQWDVIPFLNGVPLNAVELQKALAEGTPGVTVVSPRGTTARKYARWIGRYLYYFDTNFDQRFGTPTEPGALMLVPAGAKQPAVFQRKYPLEHLTYTNSVASFYAPPKVD